MTFAHLIDLELWHSRSSAHAYMLVHADCTGIFAAKMDQQCEYEGVKHKLEKDEHLHGEPLMLNMRHGCKYGTYLQCFKGMFESGPRIIKPGVLTLSTPRKGIW